MAKKKQGKTLEETTRAKIAEQLPDAIDHALCSYRDFYAQDSSSDAKTFSAHHSACKTAIAHIELLLKLAAWAHLPRDGGDADLAALLSSAQAELDRYNAEEEEEDDE